MSEKKSVPAANNDWQPQQKVNQPISALINNNQNQSGYQPIKNG